MASTLIAFPPCTQLDMIPANTKALAVPYVMNAKVAMATMISASHATLWKCGIQMVGAGKAAKLLSVTSPSILLDLMARITTLKLSASPLAATMSR